MKTSNDYVRWYMELIHGSWSDIQMMPYRDYIDQLKWKIDIEQEKNKKLEEKSKQLQEDAERKKRQRKFDGQKNRVVNRNSRR